MPEPIAASVLFLCRPDHDGKPMRALLVKRSLDEENYAGYWSIPGGHLDGEETPQQAAVREVKEEIGHDIDAGELEEVADNGRHKTYRAFVDDEFEPALNAEHTEFSWVPLNGDLPKPLHPGVKGALAKIRSDKAEDCLLAGDEARGWTVMACDRALGPFASQDLARRAFDLARGKKPVGLAYDKSARMYDSDGRLHLELTHISKATVNPYLGREIPDWQALGLEAEKVYQLFRDPQELAKAAATANGIPVLIEHIPVSADDHQPDSVVGATGTNAAFNDPYLDVALVVWAKDAISRIESGEQKELSSAYRYRPDMQAGEWQGQKYDGVMRELAFNHVALVQNGRAGPDVVVADAALPNLNNKETDMAKEPIVLSRTATRFHAALLAHLSPKLAQDAKLDLVPILQKVTRKNLMAADGKSFKKDALEMIVKLAKDAADPLLAPEAKAAGGVGPDDVIIKLLDMVGAPPAGETPDMDEAPPAVAAAATDPNSATPAGGGLADFLKECGLDEAKIAEALKRAGGAAKDSDDPDKDKEPAKDEEPVVTQTAMDAAISAAVKKASADTEARVMQSQRALAEAREFVRPWVGDVSLAHDSAEAVLRATVARLGVKAEGLHVDALRPIIEAQPKPGDRKAPASPPAMDSATASDFSKRFPHAANIRIAN
jgi:8-oxo-dGTP pyrophosphatase MutT (NUDIX family)